MNLDELESQTRDAVEQTLNQLQTATLLLAELENQVAAVSRSVQNLSQVVEGYVTQQRN